MCLSSFMFDTDIIKCLVEDLLDRICSANSTALLPTSPAYYSSRALENKFQQSINILNQSIKQLLTYELHSVVNNGQLTTASNMRHSRYYNPATAIKQSNDLKKRLHWIEQRQMLVKQLDAASEKQHAPVANSLEHVWFDHRLKMLDSSLDLLRKQTGEEKLDEDASEDASCARCRVYQRRKEVDSQLLKNLKRARRIRMEHNYSTAYVQYSSPESDLIFSLSKIADRIGHSSNLNASSHTKKLPASSTLKKKQPAPPKLHTSVSLIVADSNRSHKRSADESRTVSNSNFISTNFDVTNKRQKRIASPQSSLSVSSVPASSASPHDILTPTWRVLNNIEFEPSATPDKPTEQQENEDISDESYIHRHIRCEFEQETWIRNPPAANNIPARRAGALQPSLSVPNSLSTTNSKQYRYRLTPNGIAYTETVESKPDLV